MAGENDSKFRIAFDLMQRIGEAEKLSAGLEQGKREYWLKLYGECVAAIRQACHEDFGQSAIVRLTGARLHAPLQPGLRAPPERPAGWRHTVPAGP